MRAVLRAAMTAFAIAAGVLATLAAALLSRPLWWRDRSRAADGVQALSAQLRQLAELHRAGALSAEQLADSKAAIELRLLALLHDSSVEASPPRPSLHLVAGLVLFLFAAAAGGYAWLGSPASLGLGPGSGGPAMAGAGEGTGAGDVASAPHPLVPEQVAAMVDRLVQRLKSQPDDGDGWLMLARSQVVLGRHVEAVKAFREAARLRPDDAALLADFADALAVAQGRRLDGEPTTLVERALELEGTNAKALALAGTAAFDRHDYRGAVGYWDRLVAAEPGDDVFVQQIRSSISEARELAGMAPAATAAPEADRKVAAGSSVTGIVVLAPALRGRVSPDDTVFVFARAVGGSRMPLAILRKRAADLPLRFTLDDELAMSQSAKLSGAQEVIVGARVSKSGNAMPQSGDLQGMLGAVAVGSSGLRVEINQEVTK